MPADTTFEKSVRLNASVQEAFDYHERPGALLRLTPPWEPLRLVESDGSIEPGSRVILEIKRFGFRLRWIAEHAAYEPPHLFSDFQVSGPFKSWNHEHLFKVATPADHEADFHARREACELIDRIRYRLPLGSLGHLIGGRMVARQLQRMFAYRHAVTAGDLSAIRSGGLSKMKIAISGASGLVGSQLAAFLTSAGHEVVSIVRSPSSDPSQVAVWDSEDEVAKLEGFDAVVHLAGESIAGDRWSKAKKARIFESRVPKTEQLCQALRKLRNPPSVLLCASATGIYGDLGDDIATEMTPPGNSFLADVARQWEASCEPARSAGIRVVHLRFGMILSPLGGALKQMLLPARFAGGRLGSGQQWWSWIELQDAIHSIYHCMAQNGIEGPVNVVSPEPHRNGEFAKILGRVLGVPALLPAPKFGLRLALGEMADALLLTSTRVAPEVLESTGFEFQFPTLEQALRHCLGKQKSDSDRASSGASAGNIPAR